VSFDQIKALLEKHKSDKQAENFLPIVHHRLMMRYGFISIEELKKIPMTSLWSILRTIEEEERKR